MSCSSEPRLPMRDMPTGIPLTSPNGRLSCGRPVVPAMHVKRLNRDWTSFLADAGRPLKGAGATAVGRHRKPRCDSLAFAQADVNCSAAALRPRFCFWRTSELRRQVVGEAGRGWRSGSPDPYENQGLARHRQCDCPLPSLSGSLPRRP